MSNPASETVKVGQVWSDNYPGEHRQRTVEVLRIERDCRPTPGKRHGDYAEVVVRTARFSNAVGRRTWIRLDRFNPNRRDGYTLIGERRS